MGLSKVETKIGNVYTKIRQIFKTDIFILDNKYILAGPISEEDTFGTYLFILDSEFQEAFIEKYGSHKLIYISELAEYKKKFSEEYLSYKDDNQELVTSVSAKACSIISKINNTNTWKNLSELSEYDKNELFEEKRSVMLTSYLTGHGVMITNKLFPMIKESSIDSLEYGFTDSGNSSYEILVIRENEPFFTMTALFYYLGISV